MALVTGRNTIVRCAIPHLQQCYWKSLTNTNVVSLCVRSLSSPAAIGFFDPSRLKMDQFENRQRGIENRYGNIAQEYKKRLMEQLDDSTADLLYEDCHMYLYMLDSEDIHNSVRVIQRCNEQLKKDLEAGFSLSNNSQHIVAPSAFRKCHQLNDVDVALELYSQTPTSGGFATSLSILMDLLFKNKRYEKLMEIAVDVIDEAKLKNPHPWFFEMAILSAFRLKSDVGLNMAAKLFDSMKSLNIQHQKPILERLQLLIALYCVQQNHLNAAIALVDQFGMTNRRAVNIKAMAYISAGKLDAAIALLRKYAISIGLDTKPTSTQTDQANDATENSEQEDSFGADKEVSTSSDSKDKFVMYKDVFFKLKDGIAESGTEKHVRYRRFISFNFDTFVSPVHLTNQIQRSILRYHRRALKPVDDSLKEREEVQPPQDVLLEQTEDAAATDDVTVDDSHPEPETSKFEDVSEGDAQSDVKQGTAV